MHLFTRSNITICVLSRDPQIFLLFHKIGVNFQNVLQTYFAVGTRTQKAPTMCCRILVTLVVAAVPVASPLLMLPLIIATFCGFKLLGGGGGGNCLN
jgi:hypothetical protein